jgi:hypothetical protein
MLINTGQIIGISQTTNEKECLIITTDQHYFSVAHSLPEIALALQNEIPMILPGQTQTDKVAPKTLKKTKTTPRSAET